MIGSYVAGDSPLHRASPRLKLLVMLGLVTLLGFFPRWWLVVTAVLLAATAYPFARLPLAELWRSFRMILVLGLVLAGFQVWLSGPVRAVEVVGQLVFAVLAGNLVMMTTRVSEMVRTISAVAIPLRRFGVRRDRLELLLSLTIGCIPRVSLAVTRAREAALARGVRPRLVLVVPAALIAIVREADQVGDALAARGL